MMKSEYREVSLPGGMSIGLVLCRAGTFYMGSGVGETGRDADERRHSVEVDHDFWIGRFAVTQTQWECVMGVNPSRIKGGNLPIVNVSFQDCQTFVKTVKEAVGENVRLPTESEWEYACRAGSETAYCWGDSHDGGFIPERLSPVASCWQNEWGIFGMHGNSFEWCDDWYYADYAPRGSEIVCVERYRVVRGGSWTSDPQDCRSAFRGFEEPGVRSHDIGLRLCVTTEERKI